MWLFSCFLCFCFVLFLCIFVCFCFYHLSWVLSVWFSSFKNCCCCCLFLSLLFVLSLVFLFYSSPSFFLFLLLNFFFLLCHTACRTLFHLQGTGWLDFEPPGWESLGEIHQDTILTKIKYKEKYIKSRKGKAANNIQGNPIRFSVDFSAESL